MIVFESLLFIVSESAVQISLGFAKILLLIRNIFRKFCENEAIFLNVDFQRQIQDLLILLKRTASNKSVVLKGFKLKNAVVYCIDFDLLAEMIIAVKVFEILYVMID
jgi:hypothetical protein